MGLTINMFIHYTVLAEYLFACAGSSYTNWQLKGVAIAGYTVAFLCKSFFFFFFSS